MPPPLDGALSDDARLTSVCLARRLYIWSKSRTERPRKTKIGTGVAHVTRDSDTTFKVKRSTYRGRGILWRPPAQLVVTMTTLDTRGSLPVPSPSKTNYADALAVEDKTEYRKRI